MCKKVKTGFLILFFTFICLSSNAQWYKEKTSRSREIGYLSIGGHIGITNYFGDLNPLTQYISTDLEGIRPHLGINVNRKLSPRIFARAAFTWGRLLGDDFIAANPENERHRFRYIRNNHFRNDIFELSLSITYDLLPSRLQYYKRKKYVPFLLLGIAGFYHNPRAKTPDAFGNRWVNLRPLRTEGQGITRSSDGSTYVKPYSLIQVAVPIGAGVRIRLTDRLDLNIESAFRILFTDYIDDVSGDYANPADLPSDLSRALADRTMETVNARNGKSRLEERNELLSELGYGNGPFRGFGNENDKRGERNNTDVYLFTGFNLQYIINVNLRCPKFR